MKISKCCVKDGHKQRPVSTELAAVVERIGNEQTLKSKDLPYLMFGATFGKGGFDDVKQFTGLLLLSTDYHSEQTIGEWQQQALQVPYTVTAFRNASRRKLYIVVRVGSAEGSEPNDAGQYLRLLKQAQQQASTVYQSLTGCELKSVDIQLNTGCKMSYDPLVQLHEDAQMFPVMVSDKNPLVAYKNVLIDVDGSVIEDAGYQERQRMREEFYTCMYKALDEYPDNEEAALNTLAGYCCQAHIGEEAAVRRTLWNYRFKEKEGVVRKIFRAAYARRHKGKPVSQMNQKERIARTITDFFQRRYELRYNEVKQVTEFRPNDQQFRTWQPLGTRELKRIAFEEMMEGGEAWMIDIELYANSSLVKRYNPIHEFLGGVGQWDRKHNYIEEYARRLKTDYDRWPHFFHRWFLAMAAQAMDKNRDYGNSMVPLLIGTQAMKKSTFCKNILPYALREYYMDDIKMDNAEQVERVLGRMWLVCIDEYNAKTDREQAKIKRLLTEKDVQIRKMRSSEYTMTPRLCSFIATTNDLTPLPSGDGSRRYLCVEVTGEADMSGRIPYKQMYAQAVAELRDRDCVYWFTSDDERIIQQHNSQYQEQSSVEEVLTNLFMPTKDHKREHLWRTQDIQAELAKHLKAADVPNLTVLGKALKNVGWQRVGIAGVRGYYLMLRQEKCKHSINYR